MTRAPIAPIPSLVIFDCDGVLIDSEPLSSGTLSDVLTGAGHPVGADELHRRLTGLSQEALHAFCRDELGVHHLAPVLGEWERVLFDAFARDLHPIPGIEAVVAAIGLRKCVASNSSRLRLQRSLGVLPLWQAFAPHVYSADDVARPKPAPDLFLHCATLFGVAPAHCVVIDDSAAGIAGAVAAGMTPVGFIDPADPREGRAEVLVQAGAHHVAHGAEALAGVLAALGVPGLDLPEAAAGPVPSFHHPHSLHHERTLP